MQKLQHMNAFFFVLALQTPQTEPECGSEVDNTVSSPTASNMAQRSRHSSSSSPWHFAPKGHKNQKSQEHVHWETERHEGSSFTRDKRELLKWYDSNGAVNASHRWCCQVIRQCVRQINLAFYGDVYMMQVVLQVTALGPCPRAHGKNLIYKKKEFEQPSAQGSVH